MGKIQLGDMVEPFVGKVGFGLLDFVGFEEGRIRDSTSQIAADVQKLEPACSNLDVGRPLLDDTDFAGILVFLWAHIFSQPRNEMRFNQVEIVLGTVESKHGNLPAIMVERTLKPSQLVTSAFPLRDQKHFLLLTESFQFLLSLVVNISIVIFIIHSVPQLYLVSNELAFHLCQSRAPFALCTGTSRIRNPPHVAHHVLDQLLGLGIHNTLSFSESLYIGRHADWYGFMFAQPFETRGGWFFCDRGKNGFKVINNEPWIETVLDRYDDVKLFQTVENGGGHFMESSWKLIFRGISTTPLVAFPMA